MNFKATCAWDGVDPWAMVFHNGSGSSLYCKDPCHFKDNIFGRGPSTQFTCQFNSNNLKSFFKRILKWYSINSFTLWWQYQSRVYMYFYYFCIRLTLHWIYLWTFKFPWKSSHHIHSIGSTYSNTQTSQTTYKDQSLSCSFCLWAFFLGGGMLFYISYIDLFVYACTAIISTSIWCVTVCSNDKSTRESIVFQNDLDTKYKSQSSF